MLAQAEILVRSCREPDNYEERMFSSVNDLQTALEVPDINFLSDMYLEMVDKSSPSIEQISPEELEDVKKALQEINWNELSGRQWYALQRFLFSIMPLLLHDNSPGYGSISNWTGRSAGQKFIPTASPNLTETHARSAENP